MEEVNANQPPLETPKRRLAGRGAHLGISRQTLLRTAICFAAALIGFWLPSVAIHIALGPRYGVAGVLLTTIACPAVSGIVFTALCLPEWDCSLARRAFLFLLGVWIWGPPSMLVGAAFSGGGLHTLGDLGGFLLLWAFFVLSTPMMATYDGSLVALLLTTLVLAVLMIIGRRP